MDISGISNNAQKDTINNFNPNEDIDLSNIEIIDTSKGDQINYAAVPYTEVYSYKCLNCSFRYEGHAKITQCPKCGSQKIVDL